MRTGMPFDSEITVQLRQHEDTGEIRVFLGIGEPQRFWIMLDDGEAEDVGKALIGAARSLREKAGKR